jgi:hypothetical protein
MAHMVKCKFCGESFDRDKVQAVRISERRYAHFTCVDESEVDKYEKVPLVEKKERKKKEKTKEDEDLDKLKGYIMKLYGTTFVNPRIQKQIKQYHEEFNYSYSGILKSLIYFYEVKGNSTDKFGNTIGIVPYIYDDAKKYFYALFMAQLSNQQVSVAKQTKVVEYTIQQPQQKKQKVKLFKFEEEEE